MTVKRRVLKNAAMAIAQVVVIGLAFFVLFRFLLETIGIERVGIWSLVLATTNVTRISELGFANSVLQFVSRYLAKGEPLRAARVIETAIITVAGFGGLALFLLYPILEWAVARLIPPALLPEAIGLLPFTVGSLWCSMMASTVHSGLDGIQRTDLRSVVLMSSQLIFVGTVFYLVPANGLEGVAQAQLIQSFWSLLVSWMVLKVSLDGLSIMPYRWSATVFREMFGYAANFQVNGIAQLFFEPTTKALLSKWGTLSDVGYFEMASRMIMQIRSLLVAANQVMVPVITTQQERAPTHIPDTYKRCYDIMLYLSIPIFSFLFVVTPLISEAWIGRYEAVFVVFAFLLIASWALNTTTVPAYLAFVGTGQLRWNTWSHLLMGVTNLLLGYILGYMMGSIGVVVGTCLAIVAGSVMTLLTFHAEHHVDLHGLVSRGSKGLALWCMSGVVGGLLLYYFLRDTLALWTVAVLVCAIFGALVAPSMWHHRIRTFLLDGLAELCGLKKTHQEKH
ncbi:MAG: lipopolysaccharide biosynthesis protein [Nitrospirota bacterium]|nr:lipopolysaccharide biosynthesis protein [Nitrospirota bacterium]MDP2381379.1 lipopolysaccharide biosynthesis protein [Nitrospirota bacterium]